MIAGATTARTDFAVQPGSTVPLGATVGPDGVNFSLFSKHATQIERLPFEDGEAAEP